MTYKTINARAESVDTAPSYRQAFKKRRCLIPSDGFYEWKKVLGGKIPYSISMKDGAPFVFAGLWEGWKDPANNEWLHTCTIITGEPNEFAAADPHPDADNSAGRASRCLVNREAGKEISVPFPAERMKAWPVSRRVNKPRNDDADIVSRIGVTITLKDLDM